MRQVRTATRRRYTPEEKIRIVLEELRREARVNGACAGGRVSSRTLTTHGKEFMEADKERLSRDIVLHATRRGNGELAQVVGELSLQVSRLKKTTIPMLVDDADTIGCVAHRRRQSWPP